MPHPRFNKLEPKKKKAILDAAAEEFAAHGYAQASFNQIVKQSGVSKGSMYYYFEGKQDLYAAVLTRLAMGFMEDIDYLDRAADAPSFWQQAKRLSIRAMEYYAEDHTAAGLFRSLLTTEISDECRTIVVQMRVAVEAWWARVLDIGHACGAIRTDLPNSLMISLLMAICDTIDLWCAERIDRLSREDMREISLMLTDLLRQIGAAEAADESRRHVWRRFHEEE